MKVVVVEDENKTRNTMVEILKNYCPDVDSVFEAYDVKTGLSTISENLPDLLLLDVSLGDGTSFDILQQLNYKDFKIIFLTAHEHYAFQAIKFSALDYLIKPVNPKELIEAVANAAKELDRNQTELKLNALLENINNTSKEDKKIVLKTSESIFLVNVKDIIRCEADDCYTTFYTIDGKKILVSKTLKEYDEMLSDNGFFRPHQSHIINLYYVERFDKHFGGTLFMKDGSKIPVASRKRDALLKIFDRYTR